MEHVGYDMGKVHGTVHTERYNFKANTQIEGIKETCVTEWHTYAVDWSAEGMSFLLDGEVYHSFGCDQRGDCSTWPFNQRFHLLLNIAVGGCWGSQKGVDEAAF